MSSRDPWLDNAKMMLVTLVVIGHAWTLLPDGVLHDQLYDFVYAWHMPAFVFVTGYLSRSFDWTGPRLWQLVRTVLVPYVVFECLLALFRTYVGGEELSELFLDPHWPVWYLVAVFLWRMATPAFRRLPGTVAPVAVATAISLGGGFIAFEHAVYLDLARVLGFLPFFVLGLTATPARLEVLRRPGAKAVSVAVLAAVLLAARFMDSLAGTDWLYYRSYDAVDAAGPHAVLVRGSLLLVGVVCAAAFLALVPRVGGWFTRMGAATLVVYLFHGFFVKGALYAGYSTWAETHVLAASLLIVVAGTAIALLLASPRVAGLLNHVVDPVGYAQRRATHAVDLAMAVAQHEDDLDLGQTETHETRRESLTI